MSKPEVDGPDERAAFARLERAVGRLLDRLESMTLRAEAAEARCVELSELVERFTGADADAGDLAGRLKTLESENDELRRRLDRGRAGVDRILARIRFMENQA